MAGIKRKSGVRRQAGSETTKQLQAQKVPYLYLHASRRVIALQRHPKLGRDAMRWSYRLKNRARWTESSDSERSQRAKARDDMRQLFAPPHPVSDTELEHCFTEIEVAIAEAEFVEVNIPFTGEGTDWELRVLPWEYLIMAATHDRRSDKSLTVVRRLYRPGVDVEVPSPSPIFLHLESVPGTLRDRYDFDSERALVRMAAQRSNGKRKFQRGNGSLAYREMRDCDRENVRKTISAHPPQVLHVSGFDLHQARELLAIRIDEEERKRLREEPLEADGLLMCRGGSELDLVAGKSLIDTLVPDRERPPGLISLNIYNSGARIAALCVGRGAAGALGFQDTMDDRLAEIFFSAFYLAGKMSNWRLPESFRYALEVVIAQNRPLHGTGIVMWTRESIEDLPDSHDLGKAVLALHKEVDALPAVSGEKARPVIDFDIRPIGEINYSMLHNGESPFDRFVVRRTDPNVGCIRNIDVKVELHIGSDTFPFRKLLNLQAHDTATDIGPDIKISLASALGRSLRENIQTTVFTEVSSDDAVFHRTTERITLLPVDQWRDDDANRKWLPSFVLPRDPAVPRIISSAQNFLMALRDDPTAGFDGYQAVDEDLIAKNVAPMNACIDVDMQVRAIWSALLYEHRLAYINPPPTFSELSQRLRTPSDTIDGGRGTCIDLALLFAACLEYVEIYPAMILLRAHAFPAYWRYSGYAEAFQTITDFDASARSPEDGEGPTSFVTVTQSRRWYLTKGHYREIMEQIRKGCLVPLETVSLTGHTGFADAVAAGLENFTGPADFDSMLDIRLARDSGVTPLPIRRTEA